MIEPQAQLYLLCEIDDLHDGLLCIHQSNEEKMTPAVGETQHNGDPLA